MKDLGPARDCCTVKGLSDTTWQCHHCALKPIISSGLCGAAFPLFWAKRRSGNQHSLSALWQQRAQLKSCCIWKPGKPQIIPTPLLVATRESVASIRGYGFGTWSQRSPLTKMIKLQNAHNKICLQCCILHNMLKLCGWTPCPKCVLCLGLARD